MKRMLYSVILIIISVCDCYSQTDYRLHVGANRLNSAFILRNGMENTISKGFGFNVSFSKPNNNYRVSMQYSKYKELDMYPVWENVNAYKIELNLEMAAHFDKIELLLYPFFGLSYNYISGIFIGKNDHDGLVRFYPLNSFVINKWPGLTAGLGLERSFKHIVVFANYRMHIVKAEEAVRIMDIGLDAGLKYGIDIKFKHKKNNISENKTIIENKKQNRKEIFKKIKMPKNRYDIN